MAGLFAFRKILFWIMHDECNATTNGIGTAISN